MVLRTPRNRAPALALGLLILWTATAGAQTRPAPQPLPYFQDWGTDSFSVMPPGTAAWNGMNGAHVRTQSLAEGSVPTGDARVIPTLGQRSDAGSFGLGHRSNGRYFVMTGADPFNGVNQLAIAIDTRGRRNIQITYVIETITSQTRMTGVVMQYRTGVSEGWRSCPGIRNPARFMPMTPFTKLYALVTLPPDADDQPRVELRWAFWREVAPFEPSAGLAIDNIAIDGERIPCIPPAPPQVSVEWPHGRVFTVGDVEKIAWKSTSKCEGTTVRIDLTRDRGATFEEIAAGLPASGAYSWAVTGPPTGPHGRPRFTARLRVQATDAGGGMDEARSRSFAIREPHQGADAPWLPVCEIEDSEPAISDPAPAEDFAPRISIAPNPSRGPTRFEFTVDHAGPVTLGIFDLQGREIARIAAGRFARGRHHAAWDGRCGDRVAPAGLYFVHLEAPGARVIRRLAITG